MPSDSTSLNIGPATRPDLPGLSRKRVRIGRKPRNPQRPHPECGIASWLPPRPGRVEAPYSERRLQHLQGNRMETVPPGEEFSKEVKPPTRVARLYFPGSFYQGRQQEPEAFPSGRRDRRGRMRQVEKDRSSCGEGVLHDGRTQDFGHSRGGLLGGNPGQGMLEQLAEIVRFRTDSDPNTGNPACLELLDLRAC